MDRPADWTRTVAHLRQRASALREEAEELRAQPRAGKRFSRESIDQAELNERAADEMEQTADKLERTFLKDG